LVIKWSWSFNRKPMLIYTNIQTFKLSSLISRYGNRKNTNL
jgi:hypothetical protein